MISHINWSIQRDLVGFLQRLRWRPLLYLMCAQACAQSNQSSTLPAQPSSKIQQSSEQSLVDGLLDLIDEPDKTKPTTQPDSMQPRPQSEVRESQASSSPLWDVRDRMRVAAGLLQQGRSYQQTVDLQSSIVSELDQLIEQLERQAKSSQQSSSQSTQQSQVQQQTRQQQQAPLSNSRQTGVSKENGDKAGPTKAPTAADTNDQRTTDEGTEPGNESSGRQLDGSSLRRNDPTALQQSVWGHLPERVRSQMQSRMVEEFLPSYRQQIEAYYRALLEERGKK